VAIVLFDGVCNLCASSVRFIVERDPNGHFQFASLQSDFARSLLGKHGVAVPEGDPESIVLVEGDHVYDHSTAALRIARKLSGPVKLLSIFRFLVPRFVRDAVYRFIAHNRYRWFGKSDICMMPTPALKARFLDAAPHA